MNKAISFKHSGNAGDIIYALAGIKQVCETLNAKADIYLWLDRPGHYYEGAKHPLGGLMLNKHMYKMLKPLLLAQPYINSVHKFKGQDIIVDLNLIRTRDIGMPYGNIAKWYAYVFPDMNTDLSKPWIQAQGNFEFIKDKVLLNRTSRYRNPHISYAFLRNRNDVLYVGTKDEYEEMQKEIKNLVYLEVSDFMELAAAIKSCKFFIGNQSMCFALAEAMKTPRILEICTFAPNVIPSGPGPAYDYLSQQGFEYYVKELSKKTDEHEIPKTSKGPRMKNLIQEDPKFIEEKLQALGIDQSNIWHPGTRVTDNSLVDFPRLKRIEEYVQETEHLDGMIAEIGVYKGGTAVLIRKNSKKVLHLFDTFEGMPMTSEVDTGHKPGDFGDTSEEYVKNLINGSDSARNGQTFIHKGLFPQTAVMHWPYLDIDDRCPRFSFVHIDCDIYQSVKDSLEYFYPKMVAGGIICLDDVNEPGCPGAKKAFEEFMNSRRECEGWESIVMICQSQVAFRI